jgi:hypothetical protein
MSDEEIEACALDLLESGEAEDLVDARAQCAEMLGDDAQNDDDKVRRWRARHARWKAQQRLRRLRRERHTTPAPTVVASSQPPQMDAATREAWDDWAVEHIEHALDAFVQQMAEGMTEYTRGKLKAVRDELQKEIDQLHAQVADLHVRLNITEQTRKFPAIVRGKGDAA